MMNSASSVAGALGILWAVGGTLVWLHTAEPDTLDSSVTPGGVGSSRLALSIARMSSR